MRSAIFQWRHAVEAESQIRKSNPKYPRSPELYVKLANAYREKGDPQAVDFYLSAAHRDTRTSGCPLPFLAADAPRLSTPSRTRYAEGVARLEGRQVFGKVVVRFSETV